MSENQFGKEEKDNNFHKPEENKTNSNLCMCESSSFLHKSESHIKSILNCEEIRSSSWDDSDEDFLSPTDWDSPTPRFKSLQADGVLCEKILEGQNEISTEIDRRQSPARIRRRTKSSGSFPSLLETQNEFQATNNPEHLTKVGLDSWLHVTHFCANIQTKRFSCKTENEKEIFDDKLEYVENNETEQSPEKNSSLETLKNSFEKENTRQCQIFTPLPQIIENEEANKNSEESRTLGNSTFDNDLVTTAGSIICSSVNPHENSAHPEVTPETPDLTDKIKKTLEIQEKNCFLQKSMSLEEFKNFKNSTQCKESLSDGYLYTALNEFHDSDIMFFTPKSEETIVSLKKDKNYISSICTEIKNAFGQNDQNNFHDKMEWLQNLKPRYIYSAKKSITSDESVQAVKICNKKCSDNPQFSINIDLSSCSRLEETTLSDSTKDITESFLHHTEVTSQNSNRSIKSFNSSLEQNTDHFYDVTFKNNKKPEPGERKATSCIFTKVKETDNNSGRIKTTENQDLLIKKNSNKMTSETETNNTHFKKHRISSEEYCTESEKFSEDPEIKRKKKNLSGSPYVHSCKSSKYSKIFLGNSYQEVKKRDRSLELVRKFSSKSCTEKNLKPESFTTIRFSKSLDNCSSNQNAQLVLNSKKFPKNKNQTLYQSCVDSPSINEPKINKSCCGESSIKSLIASVPDDKNYLSKNESALRNQVRHRVKNNLTENASVFDKNEFITNYTQNENKSPSSFLKKTYETENVMKNISENQIHETKLVSLKSKALTTGFRESASSIKNHSNGEKWTVLSETFDRPPLKVLDVSLVTNISHACLESDSLVEKTPRSLFKFTKNSHKYEYAYAIGKNEALEKIKKNCYTKSEQKETKIQTCFTETKNAEKPKNQGDGPRKINSTIKLKQSQKFPRKSWAEQNSTSDFIKKSIHKQETPFSKETCMFFNNLKISKSDSFMYKNINSKVSPEYEESTIKKKCDINMEQKALNLVFKKYSSDSLQEPGDIEMKPLYFAPKIYLNSNVQTPKEESVKISKPVNHNIWQESSKISTPKDWLILKEEKHKKARRKKTRQEFSEFRVKETELRTNWGSQNSMAGLKFKNSGCLQKFYKRFFSVFCITSGTSVASTK